MNDVENLVAMARDVANFERQGGRAYSASIIDQCALALEVHARQLAEARNAPWPEQPNKEGGWTLEYHWLERVKDLCEPDENGGTPGEETIEAVLLAAREALRNE